MATTTKRHRFGKGSSLDRWDGEMKAKEAARESLRTALTVALRVLETLRSNDLDLADSETAAYWRGFAGDGAVALELVRAELEKLQ